MANCVICGNEIIGKRSDAKYCSNKCQTRKETIQRVEKHRQQVLATLEEKECVECSTKFYPHIRNRKQACCSKPCTIKHNNRKAVEDGRKKEYSRTWRQNYLEEKRAMDLDYANRKHFGGLKYEVLKRDEHKCQTCGEDRPEQIVIHHKDENKKNNVMENLITLCRACHAREHNRLRRLKGESL